MRDFLNGILIFIGASTLTDEEFATCVSSSALYNQATYDDLARVLNTRSGISTAQQKLVGFYSAKGVTVTPAKVGKSNIFVGSAL